ncbi:LRR receptor-like kinase resistance protein, partial [Trifolium pratense]
RDLSWNQFSGPIPLYKLADNMTTVDLSHNKLNGTIPRGVVYPHLQRLQLENNLLTGSFPTTIWQNISFSRKAKLIIDIGNNLLSDIFGDLNPPENVTLRLSGNPVCKNSNIQRIGQFCVLEGRDIDEEFANSTICPKGGKRKTGILVAIIIAAVACVLAISAIIMLLMFRRNVKYQHLISRKRMSSSVCIKIDGVKSFTLKELTHATNKFDISSKVGEGGYGIVYKGILSDETFVAVKRAGENSLQGQKEFLTEIELLSRLHHRNLVSLTGYCNEDGEQMLVYEFMPNGTLREWISGKSKKCKEGLSFFMRLRIAMGASKGILYLHTEANPPIYHRDIKASNILLDSNFTAKVADFGLSRLIPYSDEDGHVPNYVSTVVKGTPGYLDPEYMMTHKLTDKSDVYSLGIVFLELLTGMHPISRGKNIVREVNLACQSGKIDSIIDNRMGEYPPECLDKFLALALSCCEDHPEERPSMIDVVRELEDIIALLPETEISLSDVSLDNSGKMAPPSSSSSSATTSGFITTRKDQQHMSSYVSGSDLVSDVIPTIVPR